MLLQLRPRQLPETKRVIIKFNFLVVLDLLSAVEINVWEYIFQKTLFLTTIPIISIPRISLHILVTKWLLLFPKCFFSYALHTTSLPTIGLAASACALGLAFNLTPTTDVKLSLMSVGRLGRAHKQQNTIVKVISLPHEF